MLTWGQLEERRPELTHAGKGLLYQWGVGLAFLSTTRRDGGPRVHPMCPIIVGDLIAGLIVPGPKMYDLIRDGRYAMHSFPAERNEDAFYITGQATEVHEPEFRRRVETQFVSERGMNEHPPGIQEQRLFRFDIAVCLHTTTSGHGDPFPRHDIYRCTDIGST
ncbi:MAG: hypothetical protein M3454_10595 [Actinomycetota bacterium]|nr:hypothetical protein [Actinomycetota bacterium]